MKRINSDASTAAWTRPPPKTQNYYRLYDVLWNEITTLEERDAMLCVSCAGKRLGRPLTAEDFVITPVAIVKRFLSMLIKD